MRRELRSMNAGATRVRVERLEVRHLLTAFVPNDPLFFPGVASGAEAGYYGQWHLDNRMPVESGRNAGLDARLTGAWDRGLTGAGVTIGILDDGTQGDHPDLRDAFRNALSWDFGAPAARNRRSALRGAPVFDDVGWGGDNHGTAVAGVAAARGGNGIGTTGAAPRAGIAALRMLGGTAPGRSADQAEAAAIRYQGQTNAAGQPDPFAPVRWSAGVPIRVKNHSYGPNNPFVTQARGTVLPALAVSAAHGVIHVFSAGNQREDYPTADSNKIELNTSPQVIVVSALGSDGRIADYSSYGANVFVTAPSSSTGMFSIATTDRSSFDRGYNLDPEDADPFLGDTADGDATSTFGGTSSAAPLVSGIMALGVEANPAIDVRMAKHLLVRTSRVVDAGNPSWTTNAAGYRFSDDYGFGLIDAAAFTQAATEVVSLSPAKTVSSPVIRVGSAFTRTRPTLAATYTVPQTAATEPLETVRITLNVGNLQTNLAAYRNGRGAISGDLEAYVTSPSGTRHRLFSNDRFLVGTDSQSNRFGAPGERPRETLAWTFTTNAYWGESAVGTWTVELANRVASTQLVGRTGTWRNVSFKFDTGSIGFAGSAAPATVRVASPPSNPSLAPPVEAGSWLAASGLVSGAWTTEGSGPRTRRGGAATRAA